MLTIEQKLRLGHVRRWHIVAVAREQTVADHSWRVAAITDEILKLFGHSDCDSGVRLNAMEWARIHDQPEVVTGDMPSNAKRHYLDVVEGCIDVHHDVAAKFMSADEYDLLQSVAPGGDCPLAGLIVRIADMMEAANYLMIFGVGHHAERIRAKLVTRIHTTISDGFGVKQQYGQLGTMQPPVYLITRLQTMVDSMCIPNYQSKDPADE